MCMSVIVDILGYIRMAESYIKSLIDMFYILMILIILVLLIVGVIEAYECKRCCCK
jgi:competence protein ComGC